METEKKIDTGGRKRRFIIILFILSAFTLYYLVMTLISPTHKVSELKKEYGSELTENRIVDSLFLSDSTYLMLKKEKAFLQARLVMAETDSIYLTINLQDSSINLEISGVVVHTTRISSFHASKILMKENDNTILGMIASPFIISRSFSTIKKEPVMIKMAPKDTSEYRPDIMPDTSLTEPVNYILEMTNGTRFLFYQDENIEFRDRMNLFIFDLTDRIRATWHIIIRIMTLKVPEYHPFVKLRLPRSDAKIIYRAMPVNGQIALYR